MGEWSNLTQREKSNIIRFAIKNGVSDINTIRDTFNVYISGNGGENEYKEGGSIHIKHPGRLTALKERTGKTEAELWATGNAHTRKMITFARNARKWHKHEDGGEIGTNNNRPQDQLQISWIENWLNSRKDVMAKNIAATRFGNHVPVYSPINNTGDVRDAGFNADYNYPSYNPLYWVLGQNPRIQQAEKIINREVQNIRNVPVTNVGNEYKPSYGMLGVYVEPSNWDNSGNYVAFLGTPKDEVKIHEFTHASNPKPQEYYIEDVLYKDEDIPKSVQGRDKHTQAKELYAALQEVRYKSGLKPNIVVDEQWLENNKKYFKNTYLDGLPNNILIRLFNELAQNSSSFKKSDNVYLAALGGKLESTGGHLYPFSFQKNPYRRTPVVRYDEGGHLFKRGGFSVPLILDKLQREEGELEKQINDLHIIKTTESNIQDTQNKKFHDQSVNIAEANKRGIPYDIRPVTDFTNLYNLAQKQDKYIDDVVDIDYQYAIPYDTNKVVKLSNGRKIPTNALDTLFKYSEEASIDPAILLGLAMKETTFGYTGPYRIAQGKENMQKLFNAEHDYFRSQGAITPSELLNYHNLWVNPYLGEWNTLVDKAGGEPKRYGVSNYITPDAHLYNFMADYLGTAQFPIEASGVFNWQNDKLIKQRMPILDRKAQEKLSINPWKAAAMQFLSGKYNPGDKTHTQSVLQLGKELMNDPVVKKVQEAKKWKK